MQAGADPTIESFFSETAMEVAQQELAYWLVDTAEVQSVLLSGKILDSIVQEVAKMRAQMTTAQMENLKLKQIQTENLKLKQTQMENLKLQQELLAK